MTTPIIVAAQRWKSNADLIVTLRDLGYIGDRVLDPTYGRGNWWKLWTPLELVKHDLILDGVDFRQLPAEGTFDTVTFDPPYIPQGGRHSSTLANRGRESDFLDRYGLRDGPSTNTELRALARDGMRSFTSVQRKGSTLIVKCMSYVNGASWRAMPRWIANDAEELGYRQIDELVHLRREGPQPIHPRQRTARRNYSMALVFRWSKAPGTAGTARPAVKPVDDLVLRSRRPDEIGGEWDQVRSWPPRVLRQLRGAGLLGVRGGLAPDQLAHMLAHRWNMDEDTDRLLLLWRDASLEAIAVARRVARRRRERNLARRSGYASWYHYRRALYGMSVHAHARKVGWR